MKNKSVADAWRGLHEALDLETTSDVQQLEMKRSFYGGFIAAFSQIVWLSSNLTEDEASETLSLLEVEIDEYVERLNRLANEK